MPSSNKTGHLRLNSWSGSDKPKKDDFNSDNRLVDAAVAALDGRVGAVEEGASGVASHLADTSIHLAAGDRGAWSAHIGDSTAHITQAERALWSAARDNMTMGTYTGTGSGNQKVALGFRPKFGVVFAVGKGVLEGDFANSECRAYGGFLSSLGCSKNLMLTADGFAALHTTTRPPDGQYHRFNESGVTYVYVAVPE